MTTDDRGAPHARPDRPILRRAPAADPGGRPRPRAVAPVRGAGSVGLADLGAVALLGAATLAFFAPVVFGPWHLPAGGGDLASFLFPMYRFVAGRFLEGDLPLWNPHQYAGAPLAADNQAGLYYPPLAALFLLWPRFPYGALEAVVMLHVWGAGAAAYAALRLWRPGDPIARPAAIVGALAFMFGDVLITHLGNLNFDAAAAWIPLALVALHRATLAADDDLRLRWAAGAGLAVGVGALAGHAQVTFLAAFALAFWGLWQAATGAGARALAAPAVALAVGAGVAGVMLLPTLELRGLGARAAYDYAATLEYALPRLGLLGLAMPAFFGRGPAGFWAPWPRVELGYVGTLPLLAAALAVGVALASLAARRSGELPPRFRRDVLGLALLGLLALALALGPATPLHRLLLGGLHLPFRAPARFLLVVDLALAWLAALGLDAALRGHAAEGPGLGPARAVPAWAVLVAPAAAALAAGVAGAALAWDGGALLARALGADALDPRAAGGMARALGAFAALALAALGLLAAHAAGRLRTGTLAAAAIALTAVDLVALGGRVEIDRADPVDGFRRTEAAAWLRREAGLARIDDAADAWQPGAAQLHGLYDVGGVHNPLQLGIYGYYMDGLQARGSGPFNLLGAAYVVTDKGEAPSDKDFIVPAYDGDPAVDVWRNERAAPRLALVGAVRVVPDDAAAYEALRAPDWDPAAEIVLTAAEAERVGADAPPPVPRGMRLAGATGLGADVGADDPADAAGATEAPGGSAAIRRYGTDAVTLIVHPERPAWALLTDVHHPGWKAEVNGARAPIARADFAFRAVRVGAGCSEIVLRFRPVTWPLGAALSVAALAVAAALVVTPALPRRPGRARA